MTVEFVTGREPEFIAALRRHQRVVSAVDVLDATGQIVDRLAVESGVVNVDRGNPIRRRATLRVDPRLVPASAADLLHPAAGYELRIYRGLRIGGVDMLVPLGVFGQDDYTADDSRDTFTGEISCFDRGLRMARALLQHPVAFDAVPFHTAIENLLTGVIPGLQFDFSTTSLVTPRLAFDVGDNRWEAARDMAASIGHELKFAPTGALVLQPEPEPDTATPVDTYAAGEAKLLTINRKLTRERTFSRVMVIGEHSSLPAPVRADAVDDDPLSATYYLGPFGDVPEPLRSPYIAAQAQAQQAADARLRVVRGLIERISFTAAVNAGHDAGDVVGLRRDRVRVDGAYLLEQGTIPLAAAQPAQWSTRERRVAA